MPQENQSELFIRLLGDAVQADRLSRKSATSRRHRDRAGSARRVAQPDLDAAIYAMGPLDCVQLMASEWTEPKTR
jgi:hypothetical protein